MAAIDKDLLLKAMDRAPMTRRQLMDALLSRGHKVSFSYVCDILNGHRLLKRNPALRKAIAECLDVPTHWIEHHDDVEAKEPA